MIFIRLLAYFHCLLASFLLPASFRNGSFRFASQADHSRAGKGLHTWTWGVDLYRCAAAVIRDSCIELL